MMNNLEKDIGYNFKNKEILKLAITHSSFANEHKNNEYNERLEYLGDAVLQMVTSEKLYNENNEMSEGNMSKQRAGLVCEEALAKYANEIKLGDFLLLGKGEESSGARKRASTLADAFEALIGAIFLDSGVEDAKKFILRFLDKANVTVVDFKTLLQEIIQKNPGEKLSYAVKKETGPDHDKEFSVSVLLNSNPIGQGVGKSKKQAEQAAAKEALILMGYKL